MEATQGFRFFGFFFKLKNQYWLRLQNIIHVSNTTLWAIHLIWNGKYFFKLSLAKKMSIEQNVDPLRHVCEARAM